jgi:hypothetical protein
MMNMKKLLFFVTLVTIFAASAFAAEPYFYYKAEDTVDVNVPCFNNGTLCSTTASCNLTVNAPNTDNIVLNQPMTNKSSYFTYQLTNTTMLGDYQAIVTCEDSGQAGKSTFLFQINNVGRKIENTLGFIIFLLVLIGMCVVTLFYLLKTDSVMAYPVTVLTVFMFPVLFFYIYMNTISLSRVFYVFYWVSLALAFVVLILVVWAVAMDLIRNFGRKGRNKRDFDDKY